MRAHEPGLLRPDQARPAGVGALAMADGAWRFLLLFRLVSSRRADATMSPLTFTADITITSYCYYLTINLLLLYNPFMGLFHMSCCTGLFTSPVMLLSSFHQMSCYYVYFTKCHVLATNQTKCHVRTSK